MWPAARLAKRPLLNRSSARSFSKDVDELTTPAVQPKQPPLYLKQLHEPKYLQLLKPAIPFYELVNVRVRGFDFPVLESYVKFVHKICKDLNLSTSGFWGVPAVNMRLDSYQPASELVTNSDMVKIHERTLQIKYMTSCTAAIFTEAIMCGKPPGVTIRVANHQVEDDDFRYIPDLQLQAMEKELEVLKNEPLSVLAQVKKKK